MKKLTTAFDSFDDILAALSRKPPRPLSAQKNMAKGNRNKRTRKRHREAAFERKAFVKRVIEGAPERARPGALARISSPPGRWLDWLKAMGDREWAPSELRVLFDRPRRSPRWTIENCMVARDLVEKRPNPNMRPAVLGRCGRADMWLYRRTEKGARVAAGSDEWRKPPATHNRWASWKRRKANAAARAAAES